MSKALELFSAADRELNCAQCIVCGAGKKELSGSLAAFGGGRAPEGYCGALYAAQLLVDPAERPALLKEFSDRLGYAKCRELKAALVSCRSCVEIAAALAEKHGAKGSTLSPEKKD